jgi:quinol monooxygenase YgiN
MSAPFIVISKSRVKPGKAEEYAALNEQLFAEIEENEPRLLAFNQYENDDGSSVVIQVHPDAESFEYHLKLFGEKVNKAIEYLDVDGVEIYGQATPLLQEIHDIPDLTVTVHPLHTHGFTRLQGA